MLPLYTPGLDLIESMLKRCRAFSDTCESSNAELERERNERERLRSQLSRARAEAGRAVDDVSPWSRGQEGWMEGWMGGGMGGWKQAGRQE